MNSVYSLRYDIQTIYMTYDNHVLSLRNHNEGRPLTIIITKTRHSAGIPGISK